MSNEYTNSNVFGAGLVVPTKTRKAATDKSSVTSDYKSQPSGGAAPMFPVLTGKGTSRGPATVIKGVYTQPVSGGGKN